MITKLTREEISRLTKLLDTDNQRLENLIGDICDIEYRNNLEDEDRLLETYKVIRLMKYENEVLRSKLITMFDEVTE